MLGRRTARAGGGLVLDRPWIAAAGNAIGLCCAPAMGTGGATGRGTDIFLLDGRGICIGSAGLIPIAELAGKTRPARKKQRTHIRQPPKALINPANAKIALIKEKSEAIFASCVSCTCSLRSLTSM